MKAAVSKERLKPRNGAQMVGYFDRAEGVAGIHDDIHVRALVVSDNTTTLVLCSVEVCIMPSVVARTVRQQVEQQTGIPFDHILLFATHTHSAPALHEVNDWDENPIEVMVRAIVAAFDAQQTATLGAGFGVLHGYNINRRWLERPTDPCVGVILVNGAQGNPLGIVGNYACHNVVLGSDNLLVSGDWTGATSRVLEAQFAGCVALLSLGGAGDVNPITEAVRQRMTTDETIAAIGDVSAIYGELERAAWNIEDRSGGTFEDAEHLGKVVAKEMAHVMRTIRTGDAALHGESFVVDVGTPESGKHLSEGYGALLPEISDGHVPLPISLFVLGDALIISHPVETFSEDAVLLRRLAQGRGYRYPMLVTYANGWYGYMPPALAFAEGGYEVGWARTFSLREDGQDVVRQAIVERL
jgi:hypothetical protein